MERLIHNVTRMTEIVAPLADLRPGATACREAFNSYYNLIDTVAGDLTTGYPDTAPLVDTIRSNKDDTLPKQLGLLKLLLAHRVIEQTIQDSKTAE